MTYCSKPHCSNPGSVLLAYEYAARSVTLEVLAEGVPSPHHYVLCGSCADKLTPPRGWHVRDRRVVVLNDWVAEVAGLRGSAEHMGPGPVQVA